ncbi:GAP family protein [Mycobacterium sp.]|uniref:GAP family protein n=1 Tax=Mycobacterium sp. TaxID=1785 RepID=UPI003C71C89A
MCSAVLALSLLAAIDPVRIGITAVLVSRPRPMLNLLAFWFGGMAAGTGAALGVLLFLRNLTLSVMGEVVSAASSPSVAYLQVATGVLAVSVAALVLARFGARKRSAVPVAGGESAILVLEPNTPVGSSRLSIRGRLEGGSLAVAFVAGLALATPPLEYMAAIVAIVASEPTAAAQVGAALMFTVVAFTVVEVPLLTYLTSPARTLAVVRRLNDWMSARRRAVPAIVVGAIGLLLLGSGLGHVWQPGTGIA